jgi:DNA-binding NarL/FixJ family response regulator
MAAVRVASSGGMYLDTPRAAELIARVLESKDQAVEGTYDSLTDREKEVLKLIVEGMTSRMIADALSLSVKTVVTHRANLMDKLRIHNRAGLIRFGIRHGVAPPDEEERASDK